MASDKFTTFYIEGNIGVGKSTFIQSLREHWNNRHENRYAIVFNEPINTHMLDAFYKDPKTMSVMMQSFIFGLKMYSSQICEIVKAYSLMIDGLDESNSIIPYN